MVSTSGVVERLRSARSPQRLIPRTDDDDIPNGLAAISKTPSVCVVKAGTSMFHTASHARCWVMYLFTTAFCSLRARLPALQPPAKMSTSVEERLEKVEDGFQTCPRLRVGAGKG